MTPHRCDYHLHTPLCHHATGWPIDFARRAVELGFSEIGFSDHSPMSEQFDDWRMALADLPRYLEAVEEARASAYSTIDKIRFNGAHWRKDIGK